MLHDQSVALRAQELCESRGGRPGLPSLINRFGSVVLRNVLGCRLTYYGQAETSAEAWFNIALRPRKPEGSLGRTAQDGHLDSHTAPKLCPNKPTVSVDVKHHFNLHYTTSLLRSELRSCVKSRGGHPGLPWSPNVRTVSVDVSK